MFHVFQTLVNKGIIDLRIMAFSGIVSSKNMIEKKTDELSSRTDLENCIPILFSTSDPCGNNRLQGTPNRANARLGAHEAGRSAHSTELRNDDTFRKDK